MAERAAEPGPAPGPAGDLADRLDRAAALGPAETAALVRDLAAALAASAPGAPPPALRPWPDRLQVSASVLCRAALRLSSALGDGDRLAALADASLSAESVHAVVRDLERLLDAALAALIDLTGYDNPEQEFPQLTPWFEFRCDNVVYGRRTDTIRGPDLDPDRR